LAGTVGLKPVVGKTGQTLAAGINVSCYKGLQKDSDGEKKRNGGRHWGRVGGWKRIQACDGRKYEPSGASLGKRKCRT